MSTSTHLQPESNIEAPSQEDLSNLVQEGSAALTKGDLRSALETFGKVIEAFPDRPEGHNNLGALYSSLNECAKAEVCFTRVLDILPHNANAMYNRGVVRARLEKSDLAREDFENALKLNPKDPDLFNNLGVINFLQGRLKQARKNFRKAAKLDSLNTNAVINLCDVEMAAGNHTEAVVLCENFLAKQNDLDIRQRHFELLITGCREALGKASEAAEALLSEDGKNNGVRLELGKLIQAQSVLKP
ncbi:MAG: tetratricopeptide repeat protein [Gemmatimonadales bacterium]|nr:tetratricopeptide repeat protein [Gemmatimonadales bacterium]